MAQAAGVASNEMKLTPVPSKAWGILFLTLFATMSAPLNMFKPAAIAGTIMGAFQLDPSNFGWTMSVYTIMGIILAFPTAGIIAKIGSKKAITIALCFTVVGSLIGSFAGSNFTILLIGRFLEGISMGLISVAAPMAIAVWFPKHKRGLGLGIWAPWVPIGNVLTFNLANPIMGAFGGAWQAVWWFGTIWGAIFLVLWVLFYRAPEHPVLDPDEVLPEAPEHKGKLVDKFGKSPWVSVSMWLLAISFCVFNIVQNGTINTFYVTYLTEVHSFGQANAAFITSIMTLLAIPGGIIGGWVADLVKARRPIIIIGYLSIVISFIWLFNWTEPWQMWIAVLVCGFFASFATTNIFASPAEVLGPAAAGIGMGMVACFQNIGSFIGGLALGNIQVTMGWAMGSYVLAFPLLVIAILCTIFARRLK